MADVFMAGGPADPMSAGAIPQQPQVIPFDALKVAPSLVGIEMDDGEYADPDESYLFDLEEEDRTKDKEKFGLNEAQRIEVVKRAKRAYSEASGHWDSIYAKMEKDMDMYAADDMWTESAKAARAGRPCLQFPLLTKFIKRIVSDMKRNPLGVKLSPREDGDITKSRIGMDLVRYIEDSCNAPSAYIKGGENAAICGLGWIKGGFKAKQRKILIKKVDDPLKYYMDPHAEEVDGSDAMYFVSQTQETRNRETTYCYEYWWKEKSDQEGREWEVYWALIDGDEVVDYGQFPSQIIPIFPVFGEVIRYRDKHVVKGVVRDLIDAQKTYNYLKSQEVETIALTPKSPIIAEEGTIPKEYQRDWDNCTKNPTKVLFYTTEKPDGTEAKFRPEFMPMKADTQWIGQAALGSINDLKEVTGIYDTALGADDRELSGKAIIAKQITADAGQITFMDNFRSTIQQVGRWICQMIGPVMGAERSVRVLGENGKFSTVDLDRPMGDEGGEIQQPIDLDFSEMDISISAGNGYATRREQALDFFQNLMQAMPNVASVIADLVVKNMDFDEAQEAAGRLYRMLPPEARDESAAPKGFVPAWQLQEAVKMFEQTKAANMQLVQQLQGQVAGLEAELKNQFQSRIAAERIKGEYKLAETQMKEAGQNQRKILDVQKDVETTSTKIQSDLLKDSVQRAREAARVVVVDSNQPARQVEEVSKGPEPGLDITFKAPTISNGNMSQEDMLLNL